MTKGDQLIERAANRLQELANRTAADGDGFKTKLAEELSADAAFLRKLKPSLIKARAKGEAATNQPPASEPVAPSAPQLGARPKKKRRKRHGPPPLVVVGAALATGIVLAKVIDWRGHAHPRD